MAKPITVRLTEDVEVELRSLATFDGVTLADEIREGLEMLLAARRADPAYRERVRIAFEKARSTLQALEGTDEILAALGDAPSAVSEAAPVRRKATMSLG